jgi:hypothetical protein
MVSETSSAPAESTATVGAAAAAFAELIDQPMFAKSDAADVKNSGAAITYDIPTSSQPTTTESEP